MRTLTQTLGQYAAVLTGGTMGAAALGLSGKLAGALGAAIADVTPLAGVPNAVAVFGLGLALQEALFLADRARRIRQTLASRSASEQMPTDPAPAAGTEHPETVDSESIPAERAAEQANGSEPAAPVPAPGGATRGKAARARAWIKTHASPAATRVARRLGAFVDRQWWNAAKLVGALLAADLLLRSLGPLRRATAAVTARVAGLCDAIPVFGWLAGTDPALPGRALMLVVGSALVLVAYLLRNAVERHPSIVAKLRVHYRLCPALHADFWLSRVPLRTDYAIVKNQDYAFIADCTEVTPGRKRRWFASIAIPPPLLHQYQDVYYRALKMFDPRGRLDVTAEMSSDTQAETLLAGDGQTAENICLALDLDNLATPGAAAKHQVQERGKGTLEKWYAAPVNLARNLGRLFSKRGIVKLMELGRIFKVNGNFVPSAATAADGRSAKIDLSLNEDVVYRVLNLGAPRYDILADDQRLIATIAGAPTKQLFSLWLWRDYYIYILDERYNHDHFKAACALFVDAIHNLRRLQRNLRWDTELKGIPVDAYQRYAS